MVLPLDLAGLARAALAAGDRDTAARRAREVAGVLVAHTAVEERGLFPPLAEEFPDHVDGLREEHRLVEAVLREHILTEQDGVFPSALARLDPSDWDRVDAVRAEVGPGAGIVAVASGRVVDRRPGRVPTRRGAARSRRTTCTREPGQPLSEGRTRTRPRGSSSGRRSRPVT